MLKIADTIDWINEKVGSATAWLCLALVLFFIYDVTLRYLFDYSRPWHGELEWHLFALIFLLGAGYTFKQDKHVRVDLFYANMQPREKALVNMAGGLIFLIPWCAILIYYSSGYAYESFKIGEGSPDPGGLPARYIIKFAIPLGLTLLLLQAISSVIRNYHTYSSTPNQAQN